MDLLVADGAYFKIIAAGFAESVAALYEYHGSMGVGVELYTTDDTFLRGVHDN